MRQSCRRRSRGRGSDRRRVHVVGEAVRDPVGDGLHRARRKVGVAGGRLELGVAEELGDHRQALAERERPGRERVTKVMEPHVLEPGLAADQLPRRVQIAEPRAGRAPEDDPGIAGLPGHRREHLSRKRTKEAVVLIGSTV